jgi:hypothetical protein
MATTAYFGQIGPIFPVEPTKMASASANVGEPVLNSFFWFGDEWPTYLYPMLGDQRQAIYTWIFQFAWFILPLRIRPHALRT